LWAARYIFLGCIIIKEVLVITKNTHLVDSTPTCQRHVLKSIEVLVTIEMNRDIPSARSKDFDVISGHEIERVQEHKYMLDIHQGRVGKT
jgi:hypothetical protein